MSNDFYRQKLMEHFKYPCNKKTLSSPDFTVGREIPSCGDQIQLQGTIANGTITDLGFEGKGCVISQSAMSMLIEHCIGKPTTVVDEFNADDVCALLGITLGPVRLKCATLGLSLLKEGVYVVSKEKNVKRGS